MITMRGVKLYVLREDAWFGLNEDGSSYLKSDPTQIIAKTPDGLLKKLNKYNHSDFKVFHSCPVSLDVIYECQECKTLIFTGDDERYNPNLRCPKCSGEDQGCKFWTLEDIENDISKQNTVKFLKELKEEQEADYQRKKKTGLNSWELWKKEKRDAEGRLLKRITLERMGRKGLQGLHLKISIYKPEEFGSSWLKEKTIPLSIYAYKINKRCKAKNKK